MELELELELHMQGGDVESSYAKHSWLQRTVISMVRPIVEERVAEVYRKVLPECVRVADLGCAAGPNTLLVVSEIIDSIADTCWKLNRCSDVPHIPKELVSESGEALNKGNICVGKTSPPAVLRAYLDQYRRDFTLFLKCRAQELVAGGSMVLTTMGSIRSDDPLTIWEVIALNLRDMVLEGLIEEEKLDRFDLPYYTATEEEMRGVIEEEGSFTLERFETIKMDWDGHIKKACGKLDRSERAKIKSSDIRAVGEPILAANFGESAMDELFRRFEGLVLDHMEARKCQYVDLVVCLTKKA